MKPEIGFDDPRDRLDRLFVKGHLPTPLGAHPRARQLVGVEGQAPARLEPPRRRLPDVVQQGGQAQHEIRTLHDRVCRVATSRASLTTTADPTADTSADLASPRHRRRQRRALRFRGRQ